MVKSFFMPGEKFTICSPMIMHSLQKEQMAIYIMGIDHYLVLLSHTGKL